MSSLEGSRQVLRSRYPSFVDSADRISLDPRRVPSNLREHIPYAELWGVADDWEREQLVERAPQQAKDDLTALIAAIDDDLDDWLAGPAADENPPSPEYIAFSAMRMAADFM